MKAKEFNALFRQLQKSEHELLVTKAKEYADDNERFANFKEGIHLQVNGSTPEGCAWNYMAKHLDASMRAINDLANEKVRPLSFWYEKLGDIRIYTALILGMIEERIKLIEEDQAAFDALFPEEQRRQVNEPPCV